MPSPLNARVSKQFKPVHLLGHLVLLGVGIILLYPLIFMVLAGFLPRRNFPRRC